MRCAVYVRVSTEMETQKSSIAHQINFFKNYVGERYWGLYKVYKDIESGMSIEKRPGLQAMIKDSKKGLFDIILTKSISRFARNTLEGLTLIRGFKKENIRFITIEDAFDSEEYDEFMFTLLLSMAQKESEKISERIRFGKYERAKKGFYNGSNPPYGYRKTKENRLIPAQNITTEVVRLIFKMYIDGHGFYRIAKELNEKQYPTPSSIANRRNSSSIWHQSTIKNILTNECYIGNMIQNKSKTKNVLEGTREKNSPDEHIEVLNTHEAIVELEVYREVQRILNKKSNKKSPNSKSLFGKVLFCGECGGRMHYKKNKKSYICGTLNKLGKKYCIGSYINEKSLKEILEKNIEGLIKNRICLDRLNYRIDQQLNSKPRNQSTDKIQIEISRLKKKNDRLLEIFLDGILKKEEYLLKKSSIDNQIKLLQKKRNEIELKRVNSIYQFDNIGQLINFIEFTSANIERLISKIVVHRDKGLKVYYNFN